MKFYVTQAKDNPPMWSASQSDAASARAQLTKKGIPRAQVTTDEYDVPTDKKGLLKWLNDHAVRPV